MSAAGHKQRFFEFVSAEAVEETWTWTFFGRTGKVLATSTHQPGKMTGC